MEQFGTIGMIVVMLVIFYFMLIRPENKKKKQLNEMRNSLKVGDEITTHRRHPRHDLRRKG